MEFKETTEQVELSVFEEVLEERKAELFSICSQCNRQSDDDCDICNGYHR